MQIDRGHRYGTLERVLLHLLSLACFVLGLLAFFYLRLEKKELEFVAKVAYAVVGGALCTFGWQLRKTAKRAAQPSAEQLMARDSRPPALLLGAFSRDRQQLPEREESVGAELAKDLAAGVLVVPKLFSHRVPDTFEEELARHLAKVGPVVALGMPGEVLQRAGAN